MKPLNLSALFAVAVLPLSALAGPSQEVYRPLHSKEDISALKPGSSVAHECPHCGTITVSKTGKGKADTFTCPECKMTIEYMDAGGGKAPRTGLVECKDVKTGKRMSARVCAISK